MNETTGLLHKDSRTNDDDDRTTSTSSSFDSDSEDSRSSSGYHSRSAISSNPLEKYLFFRGVSVIFACVLLIISIAIIHSTKRVTGQHHDHNIPTLLGVRNEDGSSCVNVLNNPLYEEMKDADFEQNTDYLFGSGGKMYGTNQLMLDKPSISFHDNLTISWDSWRESTTSRWRFLKDQSRQVIALYCPANQSDPKQFLDATVIQMDIQNITSARSPTARFEWFLPSFPIIREDTCEFRLWSRDTRDPFDRFELLAKTDVLNVKNGPDAPATIHLALTEKSDQMRVHFSTGVPRSSEKRRVPHVLFSKDIESLERSDESPSIHMNTGNSTTYQASDMCQAPANQEEPGKFMFPGLLHSVIMNNLEPDTTYYYKVGVIDLNLVESIHHNVDMTEGAMSQVTWSEIYRFQSPIPPGTMGKDENKPMTFVVYGDQGVPGCGVGDDGDKVSRFVAREIETHGIRAVHHFGDLGYARGVAHIWDLWLEMTSIFSTTIPLMVGMGNHEYDHTGGGEGKDPSGVKSSSGYMPEWGNFGDDSGGECGVPTSKRFIAPANGNGIFWYSWDYGLVHTIMLSSEHDLSPGSDQYTWLAQNLASVDRSLTPWVIVESHRPLYMNLYSPDDLKVGFHTRMHIENLLKDHAVDLFLAGHYHSYFRSCPGLYGNKCNNGGLTHITVGTAGAALEMDRALRRSWVANYSRDWGYGRITVANATALYFEFVSDADGITHDSTWIYR